MKQSCDEIMGALFVIFAVCFDAVRHMSLMFSFVGLIYVHILKIHTPLVSFHTSTSTSHLVKEI